MKAVKTDRFYLIFALEKYRKDKVYISGRRKSPGNNKKMKSLNRIMNFEPINATTIKDRHITMNWLETFRKEWAWHWNGTKLYSWHLECKLVTFSGLYTWKQWKV